MIFAHEISRAFGAFARTRFGIFQRLINSAYVRLMGLDMSEFRSAGEYRNLNELFTRRLEVPRHIDRKNDSFISPCDGKVLACGVGQGDMAMSIKGHTYSVYELLDRELDGGFSYVNIYLSPKDYHRYHAPCDMQILSASYIPGALYSVSESALKKHPDLYALNERVVLHCNDRFGQWFYLVFVGAINVAKMSFSFDKSIQTNAKSGAPSKHNYKDCFLTKGDDMGCFELGSTIVIIAQDDAFKFDDLDNKSVKFGEKIGTHHAS